MRAVVIRDFGDADVLEIETLPDPVAGAGELLVKVGASGVNRADLLQRQGKYPAPPDAPQDIPGLEFVGEVDALGSGVTSWRVGQRVMGIVSGGGYGEKVVVHEEVALPVPDGLDTVSAGAIPEVFMTAFDAVFLQAELRAGETLLVHAVGSGVGTAAIQLARRHGVRTLGTSRTEAKLDRARSLGMDRGFAGGESWAEAVLASTQGAGVDVILDLVGGPYLSQNQQVLGAKGRHIVVGVPGGPKAELNLRALMAKRARILGTVLRARALGEKAVLARAFRRQVLPGFSDSSLVPVVDRVFPATEAAAAHRYMESNQNFGKILLSWA